MKDHSGQMQMNSYGLPKAKMWVFQWELKLLGDEFHMTS